MIKVKAAKAKPATTPKKSKVPSATAWPNLKKAWDDYGHGTKWDELDGIKSSFTHGYVVVRWTYKDGRVGMADLASPDGGKSWEMQNDGFVDITEAEWKKLRCVPDCDWFEIPGHKDFGRGLS